MTESMIEKIHARSIPEPNSGCWLWLGETNDRGYGKVGLAGRKIAAHRASYEAFNGPIHEGLMVRHHCDNPSCVNPEHLAVGTCKDNVADRERRGRGPRSSKIVCLHGHPLSGKNLYVSKRGFRNCRICVIERQRQCKARKRWNAA